MALYLGTLNFVACFRERLFRLMKEFIQSGPGWPGRPPNLNIFFACSIRFTGTNDSTSSPISFKVSGKPSSANFTMHSFNSISSSFLKTVLRPTLLLPPFLIYLYLWTPYFFDKSVIEVPATLCSCKAWFNATSVQWQIGWCSYVLGISNVLISM